MHGAFLQRMPDAALEQDCRDVEATVSRVAKVVLHASALADRMDTAATADCHTSQLRLTRLRRLRDAAEAGRRTLWQVGLAGAPAGRTVTPRSAPPG